MEIKIRKAQAKDVPKIAEMLRSIGELHHSGRPDIYKDNLQKYNEQEIEEILKDEKTPVFVATDESDGVVGYAFCIIKEVTDTKALVARRFIYIDDFCVDEKYRKMNIGRILMESVIEEAKKMNVSSIELNVWEFNENAVKFYEKCGFTTQKREMEIIL